MNKVNARKMAPRMSFLTLILKTTFFSKLNSKTEAHDGAFINQFYKEHLQAGHDLYIVAGELGFILENSASELLAIFRQSLVKNKICIIAGPKIQIDGESNPLVDLLKEESPNFSLLYINEKYAPKFHFAIAGHDVLMEYPHDYDTPTKDKRARIIRNSVAFRYDCTKKFKDLIKHCEVLTHPTFQEFKVVEHREKALSI